MTIQKKHKKLVEQINVRRSIPLGELTIAEIAEESHLLMQLVSAKLVLIKGQTEEEKSIERESEVSWWYLIKSLDHYFDWTYLKIPDDPDNDEMIQEAQKIIQAARTKAKNSIDFTRIN